MKRFEILNHGYCHSDYFQGCGTYGTRFTHCITGAGANAAEAYRDAVEQVYSSELSEAEVKALKLPSRPRGINAKDRVPASYSRDEECNVYFYVSIRF